ncbi:MAG TPA: PAS domain S-box protein [Gaiellaceae bacterium]|jgi:PAS domain S-box-containing protein|nr:PAS domain S-box protein [Gaiellaceae bacterium]
MALNAAQPLVQAGLLGEAIDAGPALVFVADEEMRFLAVNYAACDALGYEREELLGMRVPDVVADGDAADDYARMVAEGTAAGRSSLRCRDGSKRVMEYRASQVTLAHMSVFVSIGLLV